MKKIQIIASTSKELRNDYTMFYGIFNSKDGYEMAGIAAGCEQERHYR